MQDDTPAKGATWLGLHLLFAQCYGRFFSLTGETGWLLIKLEVNFDIHTKIKPQDPHCEYIISAQLFAYVIYNLCND